MKQTTRQGVTNKVLFLPWCLKLFLQKIIWGPSSILPVSIHIFAPKNDDICQVALWHMKPIWALATLAWQTTKFHKYSLSLISESSSPPSSWWRYCLTGKILVLLYPSYQNHLQWHHLHHHDRGIAWLQALLPRMPEGSCRHFRSWFRSLLPFIISSADIICADDSDRSFSS